MKTYGILETKTLVSIITNDDGTPLIESICPDGQYYLDHTAAPWNQPSSNDFISSDPADYPGLWWTPPVVVELIKLPPPSTEPGKIADPFLLWTDVSVIRDWKIRDMSPIELADSLRKTWETTREFLGEFTMEELGGMGVSMNPTIAALRLLLSTWVGPIYSDDVRVKLGMSAIMNEGIISPERHDQILTK